MSIIQRDELHLNGSAPMRDRRAFRNPLKSSNAGSASIRPKLSSKTKAALNGALWNLFGGALIWMVFGIYGVAITYLLALLMALIGGGIGKIRATFSSTKSWVARDKVTGLFDEAHFLRELDLACRHAECGAMAGVLLVHVDALDATLSNGNTVQRDEIARIVAECLVNNVRHSDCVVRLDGARFAILQRLIRSADACTGLKVRISNRLSRALYHGTIGRHITVRVACALASKDAIVPSIVFATAEQSLMRQLADLSNGERHVGDVAQEHPALRKAATSSLPAELDESDCGPVRE